ncbi:unnamed protein product [Sphagnum jensenii]|jgi:hypothetical protein|uniref:Fungal lipase-type domain-containing protein n=1 Tax=Sphagnum jensenii TaxID=128206 RepID=A0ABP0WEU8_9BRYO
MGQLLLHPDKIRFKNAATVSGMMIEQPPEGIDHIKQEVVDSLIATRAAYEPTSAGVEEVLNRKYDLHTSKYELLYHRDFEVANNVLGSSVAAQQQQIEEGMGGEQCEQVFVIVRSSSGHILVACRGTFGVSDILQDMKLAKLSVPFARRGRAQIGFVERAMCLPLELFLSLLRAGEKLIFTGHSMGGAVASLVALRVLEALASVPRHRIIARTRVQCITFATVPFADLQLAEHIDSCFRDCFHNVISKHDIVPRAHNVLPNLIFPLARSLIELLEERWELRACKALLEHAAATGLHCDSSAITTSSSSSSGSSSVIVSAISVQKLLLKLEQSLPILWPLTWFFTFVLQCADSDEESLLWSHCGHLLLLDPQAQEPSALIRREAMHTLDEFNCMEGKSMFQIYFEHGLANHYACLARSSVGPTNSNNSNSNNSSSSSSSNNNNNNSSSSSMSCTMSLADVMQLPTGLSMKEVMGNPWTTCLQPLLHKMLLKLTGNDFQTFR